MNCNACGAENGPHSVFCHRCATKITGPGSSQGDRTGGVIPYKNPQALAAYYLGLFSIIPFLGLFLGIAAIVLGKLGLDKRKENPAIKGKAHAWVGLGCGSLFVLIWGGLLVVTVLSLASG